MVDPQFRIFSDPGLVMLFMDRTAYEASVDRRSSAHVTGTVISSRFLTAKGSRGAYYPVIEFASADGRKYQFTGNEGLLAAPFEPGKQLPVVYSQDAPESAAIDRGGDQYFDSIRLSCMGIAFTLIGGIPLYLRFRKERRSEWLKRNGLAIEATIRRVDLRTNLEVMDVTRIVFPLNGPIRQQNKDTNFSATISGSIPPHMPPSKTIKILVDPKNPSHYWMDTSFLPKQAS